MFLRGFGAGGPGCFFYVSHAPPTVRLRNWNSFGGLGLGARVWGLGFRALGFRV